MNYKIAFYKGTSNRLWYAIQQWAVRIWTLGKYSHSEFIEANDSQNPREWTWMAATSYHPGWTVKRKMSDYKSENWDIFDLPMGYDYEDSMVWTDHNLNLSYDWVGIWLSQFIPLNIDEKDKYFCSEFTAHQLQESSLLPSDRKAESYSPNSLYRELKHMGVLRKWLPVE